MADVFASVPRKDRRVKGDCYLRGLMMNGRRKSVQAMASRLPDGNEQNLQQFVNQSTWDPVPVRRRIAERLVPRTGPDAWAIDDVSFPKDGRMSVGVAHQYCGALGKQANCQVAVSVHAVSDAASCPLDWRLFLPREWADDAVRRRRTGVPEDVGHREKWRLALDALDDWPDGDLFRKVVPEAVMRQLPAPIKPAWPTAELNWRRLAVCDCVGLIRFDGHRRSGASVPEG
ncbi:IS4 family transposase [Streptomyces hygroscopicus subsp. jinggangensis 5008]|nr:IS4 family transposase [Streptomyces hygroscopicus subsp. jinggangensis 5008]